MKQVILLLDVQARDRDLTGNGAAGVNVLLQSQRIVIILVAEACVLLVLSLVNQAGRKKRWQITGTRLDQTAVCSSDLFPGNCNFQVLFPGECHRVVDAVVWASGAPCDWQAAKQGNCVKFRTHSTYSFKR